MSMTRLLVLSALSASMASTAFAQDEGQVKYRERTEIDFEGVDVSGELVKPAGGLILDRKKAEFNPLIRLREDFNPEMKQSIDEVK